MKKNILFVHQSSDMYGSDKALLSLVVRLNRDRYHPIVFIPAEGPLLNELRARKVECHIVPIAKLSRASLSLRGIGHFAVNLYRSMKIFNHLLSGRNIALVHSNTLAVFSGAWWAHQHRIPHLWHVHEIIVHPAFVRQAYALLLGWLSVRIVCVSHAAKNNLLIDRPALVDKISVVWNGLSRQVSSDERAIRAFRQKAGVRNGDVLIALVARINRLKGQRLLIDAVSKLWGQGIRNLRVVMVGSAVPGQEHFLDALNVAVENSPARQCFSLHPFMHDVWTVWDSCDISVIPSTEPESFGMVALEAMVSAKPVIAANHGGVAEIVVEGETGLLVPPCDVDGLAVAIEKLATNKELRTFMGMNGAIRHQREFTLDAYVKNMEVVYETIFE